MNLIATATILTSGLVIAASSLHAAAVEPVDILINRLVQKKVITEDDAADIRAEIATIKQEEDAKKKSFNATGKTPVKIGGLVQGLYSHSDLNNTNDSFSARRVRLIIQGDAAKKVDYYFQTELAGSQRVVSSASYNGSTLTQSSANVEKPVVLDAYAGYKFAGTNRLNFGQQKIPFGYESLQSDWQLDFINRSDTTETLAPGRDTRNSGRDVGLVYSGSRAFDDAATRTLDYSLGFLNGSGINVADDNDRKDYAARAVWKPGVTGLQLGVNYYNGCATASNVKHNRQSVELVYAPGPWALRSEYLTGKDGNTEKDGYYVTYLHNTGPNTQVALRYDHVDPSKQVASDTLETWTLGWNWFLNKDGYTRLQLNWERKDNESLNDTYSNILAQITAGF